MGGDPEDWVGESIFPGDGFKSLRWTVELGRYCLDIIDVTQWFSLLWVLVR